MFNLSIIDIVPTILNFPFDVSNISSSGFRQSYFDYSKLHIPELSTPIQIIFKMCQPYFSNETLPQIYSMFTLILVLRAFQRLKGTKFSDEENRLLLLGLIKFGRRDLASICEFYLPARSPEEIKRRIQNMRYNRKIACNDVMKFLLIPFKPMIEIERQILCSVHHT